MRKISKLINLIHTIQQAFSGVILGRTIRQICDATNEIKTEIEQSIPKSPILILNSLPIPQKIGKLKNDLTK